MPHKTLFNFPIPQNTPFQSTKLFFVFFC
uniref:Uncharacterized protein n=1 Tax=Anguilla anguilla TaxID=7936 RepID=A0A0E9PXA1_ANGAN